MNGSITNLTSHARVELAFLSRAEAMTAPREQHRPPRAGAPGSPKRGAFRRTAAFLVVLAASVAFVPTAQGQTEVTLGSNLNQSEAGTVAGRRPRR